MARIITKISQCTSGSNQRNLFSHLPFCCLLAEIVLEKVRPQKHGLDIPLKLIASLQCTLESCVPLVGVTCVQNLVVRVDTSLHDVQISPAGVQYMLYKASLLGTCILLSVISAASSFSSRDTEVWKATAIKLRSTDMNGKVYRMMALCRMSLYRVSICPCRCISSSRFDFSFSRYPRHDP